VVRKESDGLRRYVHLGTGNYNPITARIYTDLSYFTCKEEIAEDITEVFNYLTGYSRRESYKKLAVAPVTLRQKIESLIDREIQNVKDGKPGHLILKMNAITDVKMIAKLYEASRAGVKIDLIVRGICSLRPGVKGQSEMIRVISIVGRYLEHSRVFYFENGGQPEIYLSSADLMGRNLERRVELMFPIEEESLLKKIKEEVLDAALADSVRAQELRSDDAYFLVSRQNGKEIYDLQEKTMLSRVDTAHAQKPLVREAPSESTS
jgi:polyphosphate kinase